MAIKFPCTLRKLTLLSPNITTSIWIQQNQTHHCHTQSIHAFTPNCRDTAKFQNTVKTITASLLAPGVASAQALMSLDGASCWLAKFSNNTSIAISDLLIDVDSIKQATLQNSAAIDFQLLPHEHWCEDFDQVCCINLSDHSNSVHAQLQELWTLTQQLVEDSSWNMFAGGTWGWNWLKKGLVLLCALSSRFLCIICCTSSLVSLN